MKSATRPLVLSLAALAILVLLLPRARDPRGASGAVLLYCAAGMKAPVEAIARAYEREHGVAVQLQYGGSGTLLSNLEVARVGDLFLAADASYIEIAQEKGLVTETAPLARQRPVLVVAPGNPKGIGGIDDLLRADVRAALANPGAASVGKITKQMLGQRGLWEEIVAAVQARGVFKPTVNEVANDVKIGTVDAGIVWDTTAAMYEGIEAVAIREGDGFVMEVTVGVLGSSRDLAATKRFLAYLSAPDKGLAVFREYGIDVVEGTANTAGELSI